MSLTAQQYADLASHSYLNTTKGTSHHINGTTYKVLYHASNEGNGYQGTIYQSVKSGEIIVAHRGTEFNDKDFQADFTMAKNSNNPQIKDALGLTKLAISMSGGAEVSVTGHSLGGALAQVTAYEYNLKAHTFNAYGALGIKYTNLDGHMKEIPNIEKIPITNHMMAGDVVSAANGHIGKPVTYIRQNDIASLIAHNFGDNDTRNNNVIGASKELMGNLNAHGIVNFIHNGKENPSILSDSNAIRYAKTGNTPDLINEYRSQVMATKDILIDLSKSLQKKLSLNDIPDITGSETVNFLLANLDNTNGFNSSVMLATLDTQEGQNFIASADRAIDTMTITEANIESNNIDLPNNKSGIKIG